MNNKADVSYREVQYGFGWWITLVLAVLIGIPAIGTLGMAIRHPTALGLVLPLVFLGFVCLFAAAHLVAEVRDDGIYIKLWPFMPYFKRYPLADIVSAEARTYNPIREYGGWGIRMRWQPGKPQDGAFNMRGNKGVQLVFKDGRRLLIGSQDAEPLAQAIRTAMERC